MLIALKVRQGDIFTPDFFATLRGVTDDVFFIPGVDRTRVSCAVHPQRPVHRGGRGRHLGRQRDPGRLLRHARGTRRVRRNLLKSGYVGRLVANDFSAAIVERRAPRDRTATPSSLRARLHRRRRPARGDPPEVRRRRRRGRLRPPPRWCGFAGGHRRHLRAAPARAHRPLSRHLLAFFVTALLVYVYSPVVPAHESSRSPAPLVAVVWQLGLLPPLLGFGIDPMSILVPFLVFAIGVSHGVQMVQRSRFRGVRAAPTAKPRRRPASAGSYCPAASR